VKGQRRAVTDRELRGLFSDAHVGGHRALQGTDLKEVWEKIQSNPESRQIIQRHHLTDKDLPELYQRFHDLITQ
jgi:hypothetical protein